VCNDDDADDDSVINMVCLTIGFSVCVCVCVCYDDDDDDDDEEEEEEEDSVIKLIWFV